MSARLSRRRCARAARTATTRPCSASGLRQPAAVGAGDRRRGGAVVRTLRPRHRLPKAGRTLPWDGTSDDGGSVARRPVPAARHAARRRPHVTIPDPIVIDTHPPTIEIGRVHAGRGVSWCTSWPRSRTLSTWSRGRAGDRAATTTPPVDKRTRRAAPCPGSYAVTIYAGDRPATAPRSRPRAGDGRRERLRAGSLHRRRRAGAAAGIAIRGRGWPASASPVDAGVRRARRRPAALADLATSAWTPPPAAAGRGARSWPGTGAGGRRRWSCTAGRGCCCWRRWPPHRPASRCTPAATRRTCWCRSTR